MKHEIDSQILEVTKSLILSSKHTLRELYHRETDFDRKAMLDSTITCLKQAHTNLEEHATKPKPIKTIGIVSK